MVINFLNEKNAADGRIYELLCHKFKLFDGVFGASDEILGRLEEGIDFERRINEIFESCRTKEEIEAAFSALQQELSEPIGEKMAKARKILLEEFGGEVAQHFGLEDIQARTETLQQQFWEVTKHILKGEFTFNDNRRVFGVFKQEVYEYEPPEYTLGRSFAYRLEAFDTPEKPKHWNFMTPREKRQWRLRPSVYTPSSKLGQQVLEKAKALKTPPAHLVFGTSVFDASVFGTSVFTSTSGAIPKAGWLAVHKCTIQILEEEEYLLFTAYDKAGNLLAPEVSKQLLVLPASLKDTPYQECPYDIGGGVEAYLKPLLQKTEEQSKSLFHEEWDKLHRWAADMKVGLEVELKELDKKIREVDKLSKQSLKLEEKIKHQKKRTVLEEQRNKKRYDFYANQDAIDRKRDRVLKKLEKQIRNRTHHTEELFRVQWSLA